MGECIGRFFWEILGWYICDFVEGCGLDLKGSLFEWVCIFFIYRFLGFIKLKFEYSFYLFVF